MVNPNTLRPYHTTLGPAAGPTCSKILAPPMLKTKVCIPRRLKDKKGLGVAQAYT